MLRCVGLEYLHTGCSPSLIHMDVKPTNILLNVSLEAKIADFGLATLRGKTSSSVCSTRMTDEENVVAGTGAYMAP